MEETQNNECYCGSECDLNGILPQRYPFLLIDRVIECIPGEKVVCLKNVTMNEPHFVGHFPDNPVMPGVLVVEAAAQAGIVLFCAINDRGILKKRDYLLSSVKANFLKPIIPGDQLILTAVPIKVISEAAIIKVICTVKEEVVAKCELMVSSRMRSKEGLM